MSASDYVRRLGLNPHPEGGFFRRWWESPVHAVLPSDAGWLPSDSRLASTSIHYLLPVHDVSVLHILKSHELWFWHAGNPCVVVEVFPHEVKQTVLGPSVTAGHVPTHVTTPGIPFGAYVLQEEGSTHAEDEFSLVSCVVTPGFDFKDWVVPDVATLVAAHPEHAPLIRRLAGRQAHGVAS